MRVIQCKANADYDFKVGAPGRVNIIGEHIDYCGFSVLPMAIQQSCTIFGKFINFAKESEDRIVIDLQNAQSRAKGRVFEIIRGHFDVDLSEFHWTNYVVCGIKGILEYLSELQGFEFSKGISCRIKLWVDGNIPQGAGLSSSSALVVASALAMLCISNKIFGIGHVNEIISDNQLAQVCAKSERFVGTEGGGMDQAISIFAEAGYAKKIDFHPNLSLENVLLPEKIVLENGVEDNICWVITDSLVESQKAISARKCFNKRVVECRLSCALLAHLIGVDVENTRTFAELLRASPKHSLEDLIQIVHSNFKQSAYSLEQLKTNINYNPVQLCSHFKSASAVFEDENIIFELYKRTIHVLNEARRVLDACHTHDNGNLLAKLMNSSHESCSKWYECSCDSLDELQQKCLLGGALGSRMTGAGWGGCVISLVPQSRIQGFFKFLFDNYYSEQKVAGLIESDYMFVTNPNDGAFISIFNGTEQMYWRHSKSNIN